MKKISESIKSLKWYESIMCIIMIAISVYYAIQPVAGCPQWLAIINMISGICGVMCIFLCAKANRINFPFAVVNTTVYMIYLWYFGIWATFWLEAIVYFPVNIISWIVWAKHKEPTNEILVKSKKLAPWQNVVVCGCIIGLTIITHYGLSAVAGNTWMRFAENFGWNITIMQWLDSAIFAIGIVAVLLEMFRYSEQYAWWIITDVIAVIQYAIKGDPVYLTKKTIYLIEAFIGLRNWKQLHNSLNKKNE